MDELEQECDHSHPHTHLEPIIVRPSGLYLATSLTDPHSNFCGPKSKAAVTTGSISKETLDEEKRMLANPEQTVDYDTEEEI